ncbi:MAG: LysR family transcriptional regulator, partial [Bdellovibrionales bacterium]|nr:LysR family transcriptional regulator [Bdellovibrionales bacterium]
MDITLEQARAFEAVARLGTIKSAAQSLNKGHSAVLYLLKNLEEQTGLSLFDRSGYRNRLSPEGQVVLKFCRQILSFVSDLNIACQHMKDEWEPTVKLVYDGVIDFNMIINAFQILQQHSPTEIKIISAYLNEVTDRFEKEKADFMFTVLPIHPKGMLSIDLPPVIMKLVSHNQHPLITKKNRITAALLRDHAYIRVRDTSGLIKLSTDNIDFRSSFLVNDFITKKQAILKRLGFGWLPEYMIEKEIAKGTLKILQTDISNSYEFKPKLF